MIRRILLGLTITGMVIGGIALLLIEKPYEGSVAEGSSPRVFAASFAAQLKPKRAEIETGLPVTPTEPVATPAVLTDGAVSLPAPIDAAAFAPTNATDIVEPDARDKEEMRAYLDEAAMMVQENDWEGAADAYNAVLAIEPTNIIASNGLRAAQTKLQERESKEY